MLKQLKEKLVLLRKSMRENIEDVRPCINEINNVEKEINKILKSESKFKVGDIVEMCFFTGPQRVLEVRIGDDYEEEIRVKHAIEKADDYWYLSSMFEKVEE